MAVSSGSAYDNRQLTHARLLEVFDYDAMTGALLWKRGPGHWHLGGTPAGNVNPKGYRYVEVDKKRYLVHQLVWFYVKGEWPARHLWFNDKNPRNTRIENLDYGKYHYSTKEGRNQYDRARRATNPASYRAGDLHKMYGIRLADYQRMLDQQKGVCAICGKPETSTYKGRLRFLAVDHCHDTKAVRGLLCAGCNLGIGHLDHDIERMKAAITYLEHHAVPDNVVPLKAKDAAAC